MAQAITRDNLGAWLLKANPAVWDLHRFRADGHRSIASWAVRPGYRSRLMRGGDRVVFWVSGSGAGGLPRGIWGLGHVLAEAEAWTDTEQGWWRDDGSRQAVRGRVEVDIPLLDEPVTAAELRAAGLGDLEVLSVPQMSNPSWVSRTQLAALDTVVPTWPAAPAGGPDDKRGGPRQHPPGGASDLTDPDV